MLHDAPGCDTSCVACCGASVHARAAPRRRTLTWSLASTMHSDTRGTTSGRQRASASGASTASRSSRRQLPTCAARPLTRPQRLVDMHGVHGPATRRRAPCCPACDSCPPAWRTSSLNSNVACNACPTPCHGQALVWNRLTLKRPPLCFLYSNPKAPVHALQSAPSKCSISLHCRETLQEPKTQNPKTLRKPGLSGQYLGLPGACRRHAVQEEGHHRRHVARLHMRRHRRSRAAGCIPHARGLQGPVILPRICTVQLCSSLRANLHKRRPAKSLCRQKPTHDCISSPSGLARGIFMATKHRA